MLKSTLLSSDDSVQCKISFSQAQYLLHHGYVRIVQYFPLTVKIKNNDDFPFLDGDGELVIAPQSPNPCLSNAKKLPRGLYEQATVF